MAGRIPALALAIIAGVSIGVSTWSGEFKEQRRRRLVEEYNRDVENLSTSTPSDSKPSAAQMDTKTISQPEIQPAGHDQEPSKLSSMLGLWAWKKQSSADAPANSNNRTSSPPSDSNRSE